MFAGLELSCINNYFYKEAQSYIFDRVLNTTVYFTELVIFGNSCPEVLCGKGVFKNFEIFPGNTCVKVSF